MADRDDLNHSELCTNCGNCELKHLNGRATMPNRSPCPGYRPRGGVPKSIVGKMIRAAATDAAKRGKRRR